MLRLTKKKLIIGQAEAKRLQSLVTQAGNPLATHERRQLEKQCNNQFNWSDGGHWIGSGVEPNCFQNIVMTGGVAYIYEFLTDDSAFKWNDEWEKNIRLAGHIGTAVVTTIVTLMTSGLAGIGAGTIAAILKDEVQASIQYPRMARGWKYVLNFNHVYQWSPHPWGVNSFYQELSGVAFNHEGKKQYQSLKRIELDLDTFPESLAIKLASMPGKNHKVVYR